MGQTAWATEGREGRSQEVWGLKVLQLEFWNICLYILDSPGGPRQYLWIDRYWSYKQGRTRCLQLYKSSILMDIQNGMQRNRVNFVSLCNWTQNIPLCNRKCKKTKSWKWRKLEVCASSMPKCILNLSNLIFVVILEHISLVFQNIFLQKVRKVFVLEMEL